MEVQAEGDTLQQIPSRPICHSDHLPPEGERVLSVAQAPVTPPPKQIYKRSAGAADSKPTASSYTYKPPNNQPPAETMPRAPAEERVPAQGADRTSAPSGIPKRMALPLTPLQRKQNSRGHPRKRVKPPKSPDDPITPIQQEEEPKATKKPAKKSLARRILSDVLFFGVLAGVVIGVWAFKQTPGQPRNLFGYSFFTVLTSSMQSELPKGSLVLVKSTPGPELQVGDDITFLRDATTVVTHRIVDIVEDYEGSGGRGFQTQGIENPLPDEGLVHEVNVIGKVVWHVPKLGFTGTLAMANLKWIVLLLALAVVLVLSLRVVFSKPDADTKGEKKKIPRKTRV